MVRPIPTDTLHQVVVRWIDAQRRNREVVFADWTHRQALERAWAFLKPQLLCGDALCYRILHNPTSQL